MRGDKNTSHTIPAALGFPDAYRPYQPYRPYRPYRSYRAAYTHLHPIPPFPYVPSHLPSASQDFRPCMIAHCSDRVAQPVTAGVAGSHSTMAGAEMTGSATEQPDVDMDSSLAVYTGQPGPTGSATEQPDPAMDSGLPGPAAGRHQRVHAALPTTCHCCDPPGSPISTFHGSEHPVDELDQRDRNPWHGRVAL